MNDQLVYTAIVFGHIVAGAVALVLFWCAALSRKGSPFHKRCGRVYLMAMLAVIITAVPLSIALFARGQPVIGTFMAYLVVLVSLTCRNSWQAVQCKRNFDAYAGTGLKVLATSAGIAGLIVVAGGLYAGIGVLIGFGLIGPILAWQSWKLVRNGPSAPNWWLKEHFGHMIGNGVATHIAFLQVGMVRLLPGLDLGIVQNLGWFGPLVVAAIASVWLGRRHRLAPGQVQQ